MEEKRYGTARLAFWFLSVLGYVLVTIAPLWVIFIGTFGAALGGFGPAAGLAVAAAQGVFGIVMIAGAQLGLAQIEVANNTAAMLAIMREQSAPRLAVDPEPAPAAECEKRQDPPLRKS